MEGKPRFLILGGCGFIGRHLVKYLWDNKLASFVCVADKVPYQIATLSEVEQAIYKNEQFLAFKQADLRQQSKFCLSFSLLSNSPAHCKNAFAHAGGKYDYVINLAAVTKYSQAKEVYDANIVEVAATTAQAAKDNGCKRYIHVSTAQVYKSKVFSRMIYVIFWLVSSTSRNLSTRKPRLNHGLLSLLLTWKPKPKSEPFPDLTLSSFVLLLFTELLIPSV